VPFTKPGTRFAFVAAMGRTSDFCAKLCQLQRILLVTLIGVPLGLTFACSDHEIVSDASGGATGVTGGRGGPDGGRSTSDGGSSPGVGGQPGPLGGAGGGSVIGGGCSSEGLPGVIVESQSRCYKDDAFCVPRADGTFCTGGKPFVCPPGQVRLTWLRCGYPEMGGAGGGGGAGGEGGVAQGGAL
jgi:hypothetical protein